MIQDVLTAIAVLLAAAYLVNKLVLEPRARTKGPDVTTRSLVRRARATKKKQENHGCH